MAGLNQIRRRIPHDGIGEGHRLDQTRRARCRHHAAMRLRRRDTGLPGLDASWLAMSTLGFGGCWQPRAIFGPGGACDVLDARHGPVGTADEPGALAGANRNPAPGTRE
jgi:hypothetical protein